MIFLLTFAFLFGLQGREREISPTEISKDGPRRICLYLDKCRVTQDLHVIRCRNRECGPGRAEARSGVALSKPPQPLQDGDLDAQGALML